MFIRTKSVLGFIILASAFLHLISVGIGSAAADEGIKPEVIKAVKRARFSCASRPRTCPAAAQGS